MSSPRWQRTDDGADPPSERARLLDARAPRGPDIRGVAGPGFEPGDLGDRSVQRRPHRPRCPRQRTLWTYWTTHSVPSWYYERSLGTLGARRCPPVDQPRPSYPRASCTIRARTETRSCPNGNRGYRSCGSHRRPVQSRHDHASSCLGMRGRVHRACPGGAAARRRRGSQADQREAEPARLHGHRARPKRSGQLRDRPGRPVQPRAAGKHGHPAPARPWRHLCGPDCGGPTDGLSPPGAGAGRRGGAESQVG